MGLMVTVAQEGMVSVPCVPFSTGPPGPIGGGALAFNTLLDTEVCSATSKASLYRLSAAPEEADKAIAASLSDDEADDELLSFEQDKKISVKMPVAVRDCRSKRVLAFMGNVF
jgi:hypothetical protein